MNKIVEGIRKYWQDEIEYKTIDEIANFRRGSFPQPYTESKWYGGNDAKPFVQVADVLDNMLLAEQTKQTISKEAQPKSIFVKEGTVIVSLQGSIGRVAVTQYDAYVDRTLAIFESYKLDINKKYFAYQLERVFSIQKKYARGSTIKTITKEEFSKFKIPLPPIEVQNEIVELLDRFLELTAELTNELEVREKQYQFYKDSLLRLEDVPRKKLHEIIEFKNGKGHEKIIDNNGKYIVVNSKFVSTNGKVKKKCDKQICPVYKDDILMVMSDLPNGRALAKTFIVDSNDTYSLNQRIGCFTIKDVSVINPSYLKHVLNRNEQLLKYDNKVDQTNLRKDDILDIYIPIPKLEDQKKIANILNKFDKLINDETYGLPAEINERKIQYQYYRNKLLDFKKLKEK